MKMNLPLIETLAVLSFILLALLISACAGADQPDLAGTTWQLVHIVQTDGSLLEPLPPAGFTIHFEPQRLTGLAACNNYSAAYRLASSRLHVGELEQTAQECAAESQPLERLFFAVLGRTPEISLQDDRLELAATPGRLVFTRQSDLAGEESAVLNALLRQWAQPQEILLLIDQTAYNLPGASLDETLQAVQAEFSRFDFAGANIQPSGALFADFAQQNTTSQRISDWFDADWEIEYLPSDILPIVPGNLQDLLAEYPDSSGVFVLSRPGFNPTGDQALVYLALLRPEDAGGYYTLLTLQNGWWQSTLSFRLGR